MEKEIKGYGGDYTITDDGKVISYKYKTPRKMATWYQKNGYENIKLCKNNKTYHHLIHRLVAEAFIPNPNNLPQVNHKNKNRIDNRVENLEWCTAQENLYDSYSTMSPTRNFRECLLIRNADNLVIGNFSTISDACKYAADNYNCSFTGLQRNYVSRGYSIKIKKCND